MANNDLLARIIHCHATGMFRIQATHRHKAKVWRRSKIPVAADWRSFASALTISSFQMRSSNLWWGSLSWSALNAFSHSLSSKSKSYSTKCSSLCPMPPVAIGLMLGVFSCMCTHAAVRACTQIEQVERSSIHTGRGVLSWEHNHEASVSLSVYSIGSPRPRMYVCPALKTGK